MKGDTIKLLNDDDGRPKRGTLWNSRKTCVILGVLLLFPLRTGNLIAAGGFPKLLDLAGVLSMYNFMLCAPSLVVPVIAEVSFYQDKLQVPE